MFGRERTPATDERTRLIARMVRFIKLGMRSKSYEQFIEAFSNPDSEPDPSERERGEAHFTMTMSPTCWYSAMALFPHVAGVSPFLTIQGGGDDYGVFITTSADVLDPVRVVFRVPPGQRAGGDAQIMVQSLLSMPGWGGESEPDGPIGDD